MTNEIDSDDESLPLSLLEQLDRVCTQFDDAWLAGAPIEIESMLCEVPESLQERLILELVVLDRDHRYRRGELPELTSYLVRFPDFQSSITRIFAVSEPYTASSRFEGLETDWHVNHVRTGTLIGPYRVERMIGRGGMGVVYLASRLEPYRKSVALKILRVPADRQLRKWFRIERQLHAQLEHPNIIRLLDGGTTPDGAPYLVMEYIDGSRIDVHCRERSLDLRSRIELMVHVAKGVDYAHQRQVVHRDLKPANILIGGDGVPRITDFGLARSLEPPEGETLITGTIGFGTPRYMAPEQIVGSSNRLLPTVDCYGLGAILYELSTGRSCFYEFPTDQVSRLALERDPTPPRQVDPTIPRDLDTIIRRALARDPVDRFPSARDLTEQLQRFLDHRPLTIRPVSRAARLTKWMGRHRTGVTIGSILSVALLTAWIAFQSQQKRIAERQAEGLALILNRIRLASEELGHQIPLDTPALRSYFQSTATAFDVAGLEPNLATGIPFRHQWAQAHFHVAESLMSENWGHSATAESELDQAITLLRTVVRDDPRRFFALYDLARSLKYRGMLWHWESLSNLDAREADLSESLRNYQTLADLEPENPQWKNAEIDHALMIAHFLQSGRSRPNEARRLLDQGREIIRPLAEGRSDSPNFANTLGQLELRASLAEWALDRPESAIAAVRRSIQVYDGIASRWPEEIATRRHSLEPSRGLVEMFVALERDDDLSSAIEQLRRRISAFELVAPSGPDAILTRLWTDHMAAGEQLRKATGEQARDEATMRFRSLIERAERELQNLPRSSRLRSLWAQLLVDCPVPSLRRPQEALNLLPEVQSQKDADTCFWLCLALCRSGRFQEARELAAPYSTVAVGSCRSIALYIMAWYHAESGEGDRARAAFKTAEALSRLSYSTLVQYKRIRDEVAVVMSRLGPPSQPDAGP